MSNTHFYDINIQWLSDRKGLMSSAVLPQKIEVATPPEFANGMPDIWSPEHLLVAAVNSCLMTTFLAIAENSKLSFLKFDSNAVGKLELVGGKYMISEIELMPTIVISDEADKERAERVLVKSEKACLISNSVKSSIIFKPTIQVS